MVLTDMDMDTDTDMAGTTPVDQLAQNAVTTLSSSMWSEEQGTYQPGIASAQLDAGDNTALFKRADVRYSWRSPKAPTVLVLWMERLQSWCGGTVHDGANRSSCTVG